MTDFVSATAVTREDDTTWTGVLTKDWALWGPSGGFLSALAMRAVGEATAFPRPVSFACQFLSRARFEPVKITVETMREGRRTHALRVDMTQDGKPVMTAQVWATVEAAEGMVHDVTQATDLPVPEDLPTYETLYPEDPVHPFIARFDQRPIDPVLRSDLKVREPEIKGFYRLRSGAIGNDAFVDAARLFLLIDTWSWLATYPAHPTTGPSPWIAPNLDFYYRFHRSSLGATWLHMKNRADLAEDGLIAVDGEIRDVSGRLLARGASQLICSRRPEQFA